MNVKLHIERLVVDAGAIDGGVAPGSGRAFQATVEAELTRLIQRDGISPAFRSGGAIPALRGDALARHEGNQFGPAVARALHGVLKDPGR